jgi:HAD superfamily hydrolase (TIGR01509 family)
MKNLIFDFGQVIIDIDPPRVQRLFREALDGSYEIAFQRLKERDIFNRLEVGALSEEGFILAIQQECQGKLHARQIMDIWSEMLVGIPAHRLEFLENLRSHYRVFLLSNTNAIHLKQIYRHLEVDHQVTDFNTRFFEKTYYSNEVRMRKPDPAIFHHVLEDAGLEAHETLFIDDYPENIEMAKKLGFKGALHNPEKDIATVFDSYLKEATS